MSTYIEIETSELSDMMATKPMLLVDVRNDDEVARGIISGAIHIPLALLPLKYDQLTKAENVVFYCHSGARSAHAAAFASSKGCKNVYNLIGGVLAWAKAGHPFVAKDEGNKK
ncbi:MAG: rhodanese-like domain-containing protein [Methylotenera sp.]|uniref:rhodanese-like domain-containing protein n=1 Tax=Methylotenera sp. TaxID=2051956 RepID=UPI0027207F39|nr:rhodanese-like domain-containing protein [Methylotenera sp.]MDO9393100.1 rhodanese-like domain-containing protein [Methylotenera sp.]MDP1523942.1 rhodanese-like domain-containing protein [Methylotenera sp.]MDP2230573.1 rhodanese-like domain-containing protein [Methylotenera sp.]MDP3141438.1 rhodanese-like domain-containing protein [Methylotenera sp.]MDZ4210258.1 rhodanese-like domain-containing protein [Methylotenera sp.]